MAIMMLFQECVGCDSMPPVAFVNMAPNPAMTNQLIRLDAGSSYTLRVNAIVDSWEWISTATAPSTPQVPLLG